jgi:hypothetical protein
MLLQASLTITVRRSTIWGPAAALSYVIGGASAGVIVAVLSPLLKTGWGAVVVGVLALAPFGVAAQLMLSGLAWDRTEWISVAVFSLALGGILGPAFRSILTTNGKPKRA